MSVALHSLLQAVLAEAEAVSFAGALCSTTAMVLQGIRELFVALPVQLNHFALGGNACKMIADMVLFKDHLCSSQVLWCLQASLRSAVAVVPQDTVLFNDTILNNIGYGRPEAPEEEIIKAAEMARLSDAIARRPNGESCPDAWPVPS